MPRADVVLDRHGLRSSRNSFLGTGGSYPAVVSGEIVVKFFGFAGEWSATWANERRAHERLALDDRIRAPHLLGAGELYPGHDQPLPYLILTRIPGESWCDVSLSIAQRQVIAEELGAQLSLIHKLPGDEMPDIDVWRIGTVAENAQSGAFPTRFVDEIDGWIETVPTAASAFVHSDLFVRHPFILDGHLSGIIDWGDAMACDPHVELGKVHLDVFAGDKRLLRSFLDAYGWPVDAMFARRCLAMALRRHAQILGQHGGGDVFYRVPELIDGTSIGSLDELAEALFGIS